MFILKWLNSQLLKMEWLFELVRLLVEDVFGLSIQDRIGGSIHFFIYDVIKIFILLSVLIFTISYIQSFFPPERTRKILGRYKGVTANILSALLGTVTPFCSCSSIPLFIGFVKGGIPLGVTFSFLITSPLVNEVAVAMFLGLFGLKATIIYTAGGILMGTIGGIILGRFKLERHLTDWVKQVQENSIRENEKWEGEKTPFIDRLPTIISDGWDIVRKVLLYVIIGIGIGAAMHGYVPENFFTEFLSADKWYAVPLAVILGVPMYANAAGIVPVIQVFVAKGVPLGTAIAFMMAVVGLSLPEATLLKKVMKWKLIGIFFGTISAFIILLGYLFNFIL